MSKVELDGSSGKQVLFTIPFILIVLVGLVCLGGSLLFLFYAVVVSLAFKSAMISLVVLGASLILAGLTVAAAYGFIAYMKIYDKKVNGKVEKTEISVTKTEKTTIAKIFTLSNISIAILAVGAVFVIISAALGCIDRAKWVSAMGKYREERGYYADIKNEPVTFYIDAENPDIEIVVDFTLTNDNRKRVVVQYATEQENAGKIIIGGYHKFKDDFVISHIGNDLKIEVNDPPSLDRPLDKLLFFLFNDYKAERDIVIWIPYGYKDTVKVTELAAVE